MLQTANYDRRRTVMLSGIVGNPLTPLGPRCSAEASGRAFRVPPRGTSEAPVSGASWDDGQVQDHREAGTAEGTMADMAEPEPSFARNPDAAAYYEDGATEYDDWYLGVGQYAERDRSECHMDVSRLVELITALAPARTLDVACGTGFLSRHARGDVVGLDQSLSMARLASTRIPGSMVVLGDALRLPFADRTFDRVLTGHFYGHLGPAERGSFLREASRVAAELVVVDSALRPGLVPELWEERLLGNGSRHRIYKRYFTVDQLAHEIEGEALMAGEWFVAARASLPALT